MLITLPVTWSYRFFEVAGGDQVALIVNCDGQLGERAACRAEDNLAFLGQVEGRLVARAQQVVRLLLIEGNRATDVGADLGVGNDAVVAPAFAARRDVEVLRVEAHE